MSQPIDLTNAQELGSGNERICFVHPDDDSKCIKVYLPYDEIMKRTHSIRSQNEMEFTYFKRLKQRNVPFTHLPECYGWVETSLGKGLVYERITDLDGTPSPSIDKLINNGTLELNEALEILEKIGDYLQAHSIAISDVSLSHVMMQQTAEGMIPKLIDGVGSRYFDWKLHLITFLPSFARRKTKKVWPVMLKKAMDLTKE